MRPVRIHEGGAQARADRRVQGKTGHYKVDFVPDSMESKRKLLAAELQRYFGETCPTLLARWEAAIVGLAPPFLRELVGRLQELEAVTNEINRQLEAALCPVAESRAPAEPVLDRALASLGHLNEIAEAMMRRLDELLTATQPGSRSRGCCAAL